MIKYSVNALYLALCIGALVVAPCASAAQKAKPSAKKPVAGPDLPSRVPLSAPFCMVNGEKISIANYVDRLSVRFAPEAREALISEALVRQEARRRKLAASPAEIDATVKRVFADNARRYGGEKGLEAELKRTRGWSRDDFRAVIREQAHTEVLREKLGQSLVKGSDVEDKDLEPLYEQQRDNFRQPDSVRIAHILVKRPEGGEAAEKAARARAEDILTRLKATPADFDRVAREQSDDKTTGAQGGKIPTDLLRTANPFGSNFEALVYPVKQGLVPEVVATPMGFHVIRVDANKAGRQLPLAEVREQLRTVVLTKRREQALEELFVRLRTQARVETGKF